MLADKEADVDVPVGADVLLPLAEVGSQWPVAAAVLKYGCMRGDLSSKLCGPVSSLERRWCCSHSHTSTCSLVIWQFSGVRKCVGGKKTGCKLQPLPGPNSLSCPHSWCLFCNVFHVVLIQKYSVTEMWLILSAVNIIQMPVLTLIHREGNWVGKYSVPVHLSRDCFPLTSAVLLLLNRHTPKLTPKHKISSPDFANNAQKAGSVTIPFCLPQFPSVSFHSLHYLRLPCSEDATPVRAAATTVHPTTTTSSSGKPLRLSSSNLPIKVLLLYDIRAPSCSINWGSSGQNIIRNPSHSACTRRTDKQDTIKKQRGRGPG